MKYYDKKFASDKIQVKVDNWNYNGKLIPYGVEYNMSKYKLIIVHNIAHVVDNNNVDKSDLFKLYLERFNLDPTNVILFKSLMKNIK